MFRPHKVNFLFLVCMQIKLHHLYLESLAYTSAEPAVLLNLLGKLKKLQTDVGSSLPHAEGLVL